MRVMGSGHAAGPRPIRFRLVLRRRSISVSKSADTKINAVSIRRAKPNVRSHSRKLCAERLQNGKPVHGLINLPQIASAFS